VAQRALADLPDHRELVRTMLARAQPGAARVRVEARSAAEPEPQQAAGDAAPALGRA
jgi:hypothetical protein